MRTTPNYYLILSSTSFLSPMIYGFFRGHRFLPAMTLFSTIASIHYWLDPQPGYIKNMDLVLSKVTGVCYFMYGYYTITNLNARLLGYADLCAILSCYNTSCILYNQNIHIWIPFHVAFHTFSTIGQILVLGY
jgi:hypothetical protein